MPFIGNQPALSYTSFAKQDFTTSATTSYTLDQPVANENEIALFINFVRQEPTTAYTASGTSLTLTSATSASDDMYCVFLGKAVQTVNPPSGSVGISQLSATGTKDATTFLRGDNTFATAGGDNTPAFKAKSASSQSVTNSVDTLVVLGTEVFDTDNAFSSNRFTVPSGEGGKYFFSAGIGTNSSIDDNRRAMVKLHKNGSEIYDGFTDIRSPGANATLAITLSSILVLSEGDYIELYFWTNNSDSGVEIGGNAKTFLSGFKLIGI